MKIHQSQNVKNQFVTDFKWKTGAGIWFVRLPRSQTVSIVSDFASYNVKFHKIKVAKIKTYYSKWGARLNHLLFPNLVNFRASQERKKSKYRSRWQYCTKQKKINKAKDKKSLNLFFDTKISLRKPIKSQKNIKRTKTSTTLLMCGDVESNPGPEMKNQVTTLTVITYNVRGLKEYSKLKRVLNTCAGKIKNNKNTVICLQETHLERADENKLKVMWRDKYVLSPGGNKSRGCIILYDSSWEGIDFQIDKGGRFIVLTLKKQFGLFSIANIYAPNDQNVQFFETVLLQLVKNKDDLGATPVLVGDFNLVINPDRDSLNRNTCNKETIVRTFVKDTLASLGLQDAYRHKHSEGGYTWVRGNCYSRLDMIYVDKELLSKVTKAEVDWAFDKSDHASITVEVEFKNVKRRGPGLPRVDPSLLAAEQIRREVIEYLNINISEMPEGWNPHQKWEFLKVSVRSIMWEIKSREKKLEIKELDALKEQLNRLKKNREEFYSLQQNQPVVGDDLTSIEAIDQSISFFEGEINKLWEAKSKELAMKARIKWFNEGEKSNKYFLNIIKKRQAETNIEKLSWEGKTAETQESLQDLVYEFYGDLYSKEENLTTDYESFFSPDTPTLNDEDRRKLDEPETLEEITRTLNSCNESAPGPDGITYKTYQALWEVLGPFLLKSWQFSLETGLLPDSQRLSSITLLPKEGKDLSQIGNWRPITLTNCDLKIFTKNMANRVSLVLNKLIFKSQTAYIPSRNVHDNSRFFEFYRDYCSKNNVDAILMSLDAKKAFDSVDHKYMTACLKKYGFSDNFIEAVKTLYNEIKADILVNGYKSAVIRIRRCVKQGDALSCALFILCLDPLIRNIERNKNIKAIEIRTPLSNKKISSKTGGFADDVGIITANCEISIKEVFLEYKRFSIRSGIKLNETKTEIMHLNKPSQIFEPITFKIELPDISFEIKSVQSVIICGIMFSNYPQIAYKYNVTDKIEKFKKKLLAWQFRGLTLGGKILVASTFGISQLIYSMQVCEYYESDLKELEKFIFGFLWSKNVTVSTAPDRIKRNIMKQDYDNGGLRVPDVAVLNEALKLKQFFRASESNHVIKLIQKYRLESIGYDYVVNQEYSKLCPHDCVITTAQRGINRIADKWRAENSIKVNNVEVMMDLISSIDVKEYLKRKRALMAECLFERVFKAGIEKLKQLVMENQYPRSDAFKKLTTIVLKEFPSIWGSEILNNVGANHCLDIRESFFIQGSAFLPIRAYTVKIIRKCLSYEKQESAKYSTKLNIIPHEGINPFLTNRSVNYAVSQRIFKFRLLHLDIFTKDRMFKFKMTTNEMCDICGERETLIHTCNMGM